MPRTERTETSGLAWDTFENLIARMALDARTKGTPLQQKSLLRYQVLIACGCYMGLRASDLLRLRWSDVHGRSMLRITEQKTRRLGKYRDISLNPRLSQLLAIAYGQIGPARPDEPMFINRQGEIISIQYLNLKLKELFIRYGIRAQNPSSHTLRKTFGRRVYELNGQSEDALITLSQIFNHDSIAITRRYIGLEREKIKDVYLSI